LAATADAGGCGSYFDSVDDTWLRTLCLDEEEAPMSKGRSLIALFIVLALIAGVYAFMVTRGVGEPEPMADERVRILEFDVEEISEMVLKSQDKTLTLTREGDSWATDYPYPIVLNIRNVEDIAYSFTGLSAEEVVTESPEDLSSFGLDIPSVEATVTLLDGREYTVYLGNRTPVGNMFYLMKKNDPRVFTVWGSHGNHFSYTLDDLRDTQLTQINAQEVSYFKLAREGGKTIEIVKTQDSPEEQVKLGFATWHMIQPYNEKASVHHERFGTLLAALPQLEIAEFIDDNPEDLAQYGLDTPAMELKVEDSQSKLHLLFGNDLDEQHIHFQIAGKNTVYAMEKEALASLMATTPFELIDRFSFIVMIDHVDEIVIETTDARHTMTLTRNVKEAEKQDEEDEVITTFTLNGKEIGDQEFRDFYQILIGLIVEAENKEMIDEKPYVTTTFRFNKEDMPDVSIAYVPYNEDFFAVLRGGAAEFLVSRKQVYHMINEINELAAQ